jgi:hypothetical protein
LNQNREGRSFFSLLTIQMSSWLADDDSDDYNPDLDPRPSEWFPDQSRRYEVQEFDWGDPSDEEEDIVMADEEEDDSDLESVNSIPMSLGSFSTQSVFDE